MIQEDLEFITKFLTFQLFNKIILQDYNLLRDKDLRYYQKLLKEYSSYELKNEIQLRSINKSFLNPTFFDEIIEDQLIHKDFYIDTQKVSMLFLNLFEDNFSIDSKFFDFIRCDLKNSTLKEEEVERFEHIINNVEKHVLSKKWRVDFINKI
jgi:hypothetical protein